MTDTWILIAACVFGLYMAWNIGANDVANAFGCSVGSGALTFRRAMILAAIFEFSGAFFAGSSVTNTIRGEIVRPEVFLASPREFAIGMLAALLAASLWLNVATYFGQPVSTTHAIIGAVLGFGLVSHGVDAIQWHRLGRIAASWFVSPVVGAVMAFVVYRLIRRYVLSDDQPVARARVAVPAGLGAVVWVLAYSILKDIFVRTAAGNPPPGVLTTAAISFVPAMLAAAGGAVAMRRRVAADGDVVAQHRVVERCFARLQILTACYISFAHGANDVANAIGPIVGIIHAIKGTLAAKAAIPSWILAVGGIGIITGLATYGYKVIESVGFKITEIIPTRGFSADFSTATTVLVCSLMGLPISTTFVLVGAVMGVGLARGFAAIDLRVVRRIFASWLITIPASAALAAVLSWLLRALAGT